MNEFNHNPRNWDDSVYGTGNTELPKKKGAFAAVLLVLIIFLCGIIAVMGILNIKLFHQLQSKKDPDNSIFFTDSDEPETQPAQTELQDAAKSGDPRTLTLEQTPQAIANVPTEGGLSLQEIYAKNIDCVVSISADASQVSVSGTGVILSEDGYLVTNAHVVDGAMSITVQLTDDRRFPAGLVGMDEVSDLAVLRIDARDLTPAQFGCSDNLQVGDSVVAIGDPLGVEFRGTYTNGIVSAINRDVSNNGRTMTLIQTNAALNSGNSGGPLINCYGQVIGINTMKIGAFTDSAGVEGIGFAIPSSTVKEIVDQLVAQGYVSGRPDLGITAEALSTFYQHYYRLPAGLFITEVSPYSDAAVKGIEAGDILLGIDDYRITSSEMLKNAIVNYRVGDTVLVCIYRDGQQYQVEITLGENTGNAG